MPNKPLSPLRATSDTTATPLLCRGDLEKNLLREGLADSLGEHLLSEEALESSLQAALASPLRDSDDLWLFAYGSLIWNPVLSYEARQVVTVHGYHRSMCLWSRINRGTAEQPGIVLGLDYGGRCAGVAYKIPGHIAEAELRLLWRREMLLGSYTPRWVSATHGTQRLRALAFVVDRARAGYAGRLPPQQMVEVLCRATGKLGSALDYLRFTIDGLAANGIRDANLLQLDGLIRTHLGEEQPAKTSATLQR